MAATICAWQIYRSLWKADNDYVFSNTRCFMQKFGALAAFLTIAASSPASAQSHSQEDAAACTPDVFKLCSEFIPHEQNIVACLTKKKRQLSPACYQVFSRPAPSRRSTASARARNVKDHRPE